MSKVKQQTKILLLTPAKTAKGGIVNYFQVLEDKFTMPVEYFIRGARKWPNRDGQLKEIKRAWQDLVIFKKKIRAIEYGILQTSTSLGSFAVIRDALFLRAARKQKMKTIAFFRGWDERFEQQLTGMKLKLFKGQFFKCDAIIVLSGKFETKLREWGYSGDIFIETTVVDEDLIKDFSFNKLEGKLKSLDLGSLNILFLARTEIRKGIYEAIDAFAIIHNEYPKVTMTIAGDGFELDKAKEYVFHLGLQEYVAFTGFIRGNQKAEVYQKAGVYVFPSYSEGMPNSVLEAMAFGLPIISTPVGGLNDFFEDGTHGYFIRNNNAKEIASLIDKLIQDKEKYKAISVRNLNYSRSRFTTSIVVKRLEKIYSHYTNNKQWNN